MAEAGSWHQTRAATRKRVACAAACRDRGVCGMEEGSRKCLTRGASTDPRGGGRRRQTHRLLKDSWQAPCPLMAHLHDRIRRMGRRDFNRDVPRESLGRKAAAAPVAQKWPCPYNSAWDPAQAQGHAGAAAKTARIRPCYGSLGTVDSFSVEGTRPSRFCSQGCSFRSGSLVAELGRQAEAAKEEAEQGAAFLVSGRAWRGG